MKTIMQGDAYPIPFSLKTESGEPITDTDVAEVEVMVGPIRKTYTDGGVGFDGTDWYVELSQTDTMSMGEFVDMQVRVLYGNGVCEGGSAGKISVRESKSKEVLE